MGHQKKLLKRRGGSLGILAVLGSATAVLAQNPGEYLSYSVKGLAFQPQFDTSAMFTDNLFYGRGALRVSDYILTFSPGLRLQYGRDNENQVWFEYMHDEMRVIDNSDFSSTQDRLDLSVRYKQGKFRLDGRDSLHFLSSLLGGSISQLQQLVDRRTHSDVYTLTFDWTEKTDLYLRASHNTTDYSGNTILLDQTSVDGALGGSYQATAKLRFIAEGFVGHSSVNANQLNISTPDSIYYGAFVGARGNFTSKLTGSARVGFERRDFVSGEGNAANTPAFSIDLTYQMSPMRSFILRYDRRTFPSPQFASQISVSDAVSFEANQLIGTSGRWLLRGTLRYFHNSLNQSQLIAGGTALEIERTDELFNAGLALVYQPQPWLRCMAAYDFENFDISFKDNNAANLLRVVPYHNNRVSLSASIGF